jgi:hypothetical protein
MVLGGVALVSLLLKVLVEQLLEHDRRSTRVRQEE